jgi:hypothetical protein
VASIEGDSSASHVQVLLSQPSVESSYQLTINCVPGWPVSTDPSPLLCIDFPCGPLSLPSCSHIAGCFRLVTQSAAICSRWFLARGFFCPEDGGDTFLRNIGLHNIYTASYPRRRNSLPYSFNTMNPRCFYNPIEIKKYLLAVCTKQIRFQVPTLALLTVCISTSNMNDIWCRKRES